MDGDLGRFYDAIENPRKTRNELPILRGDELRAYMDEVRSRTFDVLDVGRARSTPTTRCCATVSSTRCCSPTSSSTTRRCCSCCRWSTATARPGRRHGRRRAGRRRAARWSGSTAASYEIGAAAVGFAYDNERPRHAVELEAFEIDRTPVTNGAFAEFVADTGSEPPLYWEREGDGWVTTTFGHRRELDPDRPVVHVSFHEATRSPTGPASGCRPSSNGRRRRAAPIRRAPTSTTSPLAAHRPAPTRTPPRTAARCRCSATSGSGLPPTSPGTPASGPSRTRSTRRSSSATSYKVLRGGAWATRRDVIRPSFRNWDLPERSQIFSGLRCVRDAVKRSTPRGRVGSRWPRPPNRSRSRSTCPRAERWPGSPRTCARASRARSRSCPRSTSTTSAARSCSRRSPNCPSTTRPGSSARSSTTAPPRSSPPRTRRR